jgi:hypothetical protein
MGRFNGSGATMASIRQFGKAVSMGDDQTTRPTRNAMCVAQTPNTWGTEEATIVVSAARHPAHQVFKSLGKRASHAQKDIPRLG